MPKRKPKNPGGYIGECGEACGAWAKPKPRDTPTRLADDICTYAFQRARLVRAMRQAFRDGRASVMESRFNPAKSFKLLAKYGVEP